MQEPTTPVPAPSEWLTPLDVARRLGISRTLVYGLFGLYDRGEPGGLRYKRLSKRHLRVNLAWFHEYMERTRETPEPAA